MNCNLNFKQMNLKDTEKINIMKNEAYVWVSENEIMVYLKGLPLKKVKFEKDDYKDFDEFVAAVVCDSMMANGGQTDTLNLVLGHDYYRFSEQIVAGVRTEKNERYRIRNFSTPVSADVDTDVTTYFESHTEFLCDGKAYGRLEEIPLLQKYLKCKSFLCWNRERVASLVSCLSRYGLSVSSMLPMSHFCNSFSNEYCGRNAVVSFFEGHTEIAIFGEGRLKRIIKCPFGTMNLVAHLSDVFNLSCNNSRKLIEMYGFVSVPQQYVHYEIAIPIFEKIKRNIKMTDISYEIQTVLKKQFSLIYEELKKHEVDNVELTGLPIVDANVLFQMMTNYDCNDIAEMSYETVASKYEFVGSQAYSEVIVPVVEKVEVQPKPIVEASSGNEKDRECECDKRPEQKPAMRWVNGLFDKIKESKDRIDAILVESE